MSLLLKNSFQKSCLNWEEILSILYILLMEWIWIKIMKGICTVIKFNPWCENLLDVTHHVCDYLHTLNTLQSSRNLCSITCPTWLPENETQVSRFSTLAFFPWSNRFADATNRAALKNRDSSKKPDYDGCEDEFVVCCCDANGQTKDVFLLLRVMTSGKDLSSQYVCKYRHWWISNTLSGTRQMAAKPGSLKMVQ